MGYGMNAWCFFDIRIEDLMAKVVTKAHKRTIHTYAIRNTQYTSN